MKKYRFGLTIILSCLMITGCASNSDISSISKISDYSSNDNASSYETDDTLDDEVEYYYSDDTQIYSFEKRYEKIKEQYPDKSVLVWVSDQNIRYEDEVNSYLSEHNKNYVLCFKNLTYDVDMVDDNSNFITSYAQLLSDALDNGEKFDIIDTGLKYQGFDTFYNPYQNCVNNNFLEPLNTYLENTECGKKIYAEMSTNYWKSLMINGKIYGIDGSLSCLKEDLGYELNADLVDKNSIDLDDFLGKYDTSLQKVIDLCKSRGWKFTAGMHGFMQLYSNYDFITDNICIDDNGHAVNIYETDYAKNLFNTISEGFTNDVMVNPVNDNINDIDTYFGSINSTLCGGYTNNKFKTSQEYGLQTSYASTESYTIYPQYSNKIYTSSKALGICALSDNKYLAFDAICEVMTNKELNDLLCFGTDYDIINGCIKPYGYYNTMGVENRLIRYPFYGVNDPNSNEKYHEAITDFKLSKSVGFCFDTTNVSDKILAVDKVLKTIDSDFPSKEYKTGKEYLDKLNDDLNSAGLQDILDEVNRQLEEYNETHNTDN